MNRKIQGLLAALALAAGCEYASKTTYDGPIAQCKPVTAACTGNSECCSYGCVGGYCEPGDVEGAVCKNTTDCGYPFGSFAQMTCKSAHCSTTATCRDDADVCSSNFQCCSGHCNGNACVPNAAPVAALGPDVTVPWHRPYTLVNLSSDANGDALTWGWTLDSKPALSTVTLSAADQITRYPTFTPDREGLYVFRLVVNDGWLTASDTVVVTAINTAPVVTAQADVAAASRNVALDVTATVSDADGDALTGAWELRRPDGTVHSTSATFVCTALPAAPFAAGVPFPNGLAATDEGTWTVVLSATDGVSPVTDAVAVTVVNDPPVVIVPATRTFNMGADVPSTPDASIAASASDANGDSIASWSWTVVSVPTGSAVDTTSLGFTASTSTATFKPDKAGVYTLDVTACDPPASNPPYVSRAGGCGTSTVVATVYPYIRTINHVVTDAAFAKGPSLARLVLVGPDSTVGALWNYDLLTGSAPVKSALDGAPNAVTLTPDGGTAVVGDDVNAYKVVLGATPTKSTWTSPLSIGDVIAIDGTDAYVFPKTPGAGIYYQHLNLSTSTFTSTVRTGTFGAAVAPTASSTFFVADTLATDLLRMRRQGNSEVFEASDTSFAAGRIWSSSDGAHVFSSDGSIYAVPASVPSTTFGELGTTLGISGVRHVDTSPTESVVLAVGTGAGAVRRYNSTFTLVGTDALPHWGNLGTDRGLEALFAFVSNDGATAYVVVKTTATPIEYGLYSYAIP